MSSSAAFQSNLDMVLSYNLIKLVLPQRIEYTKKHIFIRIVKYELDLN